MAINFLNTVAVDENVLFVDATNNRVGVGTSTPGSVLDVQGSQGQLFSITDDLSGDIFAVSDISGVPIMTVNSSGLSTFAGTVTSTTFLGDLNGTINTATTGVTQTTGDNSTKIATTAYADAAAAAVPIGNYVTLATDQTITGNKTFSDGPYYNGTTYWRVSSTDAALQRADARDDGTNYSRLHWYGVSDTGATSNFRHAYYDGGGYINVTADSGRLTFGGKVAGSTPTAAGDLATKAYVDALTPGAGVFLPLAGGTMTGAINAGGGLYYVGDSNMGFVPYPIGAQFRSDSSALAGYIKIELPTDIGTNPDDMVSFYVDVYDYTTNEMISIFIGGYTYTSGGAASSYWYNCTAIINTKQRAKDFDVKFGFDGTHFYVAIGETTSVWSHPSIVVRDVQCSYRSNVVHYIDGWDVSVTTTALVGVDETQTGNLPQASGAATAISSTTQTAGNNSTLIATTAYADAAAAAVPVGDYLPLAGGTMSGGINMAGNAISGSNYNITGVNQITINDPGEGIVFTGTTNVNLYVIDDTTDSIVNFDNASEIRRDGVRVADVPYIASRSQQLMTNYNGLLGNNYNFPGWTFDGEESNYSPGSFKFVGSSGNSFTSEYIAVDTAYKYKMSLDAKTLNGVGRYYCMTLCYDVDQNQINANMHMYRANTSTTLAVALNPGDTTITLAGTGSNWYDGGTAGVSTHLRSLIIWEYTNSLGYTYPPETYSRLWYSNVWDPNNINGNVITLRTAWTGPSYPVGTRLSNGSSGGSYKYNVMSNTLLTTDWVQYSGFMDGVDLSGTNVYNKFPPGTAKIRMGFLPNYNAGSTGADTIWITNFNVGIDNVLTKGDQSIAGAKTFTTVPVVGTMATTDNSTSAASTAYVTSKVTSDLGAYLPLAAGSGSPLTGDLYIEGADKALRINNGTQPVVYLGDGGANTDGQLILYNSTGGVNVVFNGDNQNHYITNGNVGIGMTDPSANLHVESTNDGMTNGINTNQLKLSYGASVVGAGSSVAFGVSANNNFTGAKIVHERKDGNSAGDLSFWTRELVGTATDYDLTAERMRISSSGNVGIGTDSPSEKLDVVGNIKINSALLSNQNNTDVDSAAAEVVAQVAHATYTAAFFDFVVKKGTNVRSGTVYACHNGDTTPLVEFTETSTNDLGDTSDVTLSVDISGGNMRLLATVTSDDWSVKSLIRAI